MNEEINKLVTKAVNAEKSDDALKFSQAAQNAANALWISVNLDKVPLPKRP